MIGLKGNVAGGGWDDRSCGEQLPFVCMAVGEGASGEVGSGSGIEAGSGGSVEVVWEGQCDVTFSPGLVFSAPAGAPAGCSGGAAPYDQPAALNVCIGGEVRAHAPSPPCLPPVCFPAPACPLSLCSPSLPATAAPHRVLYGQQLRGGHVRRLLSQLLLPAGAGPVHRRRGGLLLRRHHGGLLLGQRRASHLPLLRASATCAAAVTSGCAAVSVLLHGLLRSSHRCWLRLRNGHLHLHSVWLLQRDSPDACVRSGRRMQHRILRRGRL